MTWTSAGPAMASLPRSARSSASSGARSASCERSETSQRRARLLRAGGAAEPAVMFRLIHAERAHHQVRTMCRALRVSVSGYYAWRSRPPSVRSVQDAELTRAICRIHEASRGTYGRPGIHAELRYEGVRCSGKRVARLMRTGGLQGIPSRPRRRGLTRRRRGVAPRPDLVGRVFTASRPDKLWVGDISYVPTGEGWLYLATILDCFSRRIVGWRWPTTSGPSWWSTRSSWRRERPGGDRLPGGRTDRPGSVPEVAGACCRGSAPRARSSVRRRGSPTTRSR